MVPGRGWLITAKRSSAYEGAGLVSDMLMSVSWGSAADEVSADEERVPEPSDTSEPEKFPDAGRRQPKQRNGAGAASVVTADTVPASAVAGSAPGGQRLVHRGPGRRGRPRR